LFDITQAKTISYQLKPNQRLSAEIVAIDPERIVAEVERRWLSWQAVKGVNYNPNQSPFIKQLDQLQQCTSAAVCQMLVQMLDGQKTLRDLAIEMKRDILTVIRSLQPYIQSGLIELANIPDLPAPVLATPGARTIQKPLIACVDDSPLICQSLERLLLSRGYRFVGIDDPLRAIGILLALKPDVIFLDLMMPNTNGYEICDRLRRIAIFRNTPIIILTGNDGVVDRVKAKMVGASDFLSKTKVDADLVLEVLHKHLRHCTLSKLTEPNSPGLEKGTQVA
jgi:chemotaxis family two-component system response regulator PixG